MAGRSPLSWGLAGAPASGARRRIVRISGVIKSNRRGVGIWAFLVVAAGLLAED